MDASNVYHYVYAVCSSCRLVIEQGGFDSHHVAALKSLQHQAAHVSLWYWHLTRVLGRPCLPPAPVEENEAMKVSRIVALSKYYANLLPSILTPLLHSFVRLSRCPSSGHGLIQSPRACHHLSYHSF